MNGSSESMYQRLLAKLLQDCPVVAMYSLSALVLWEFLLIQWIIDMPYTATSWRNWTSRKLYQSLLFHSQQNEQKKRIFNNSNNIVFTFYIGFIISFDTTTAKCDPYQPLHTNNNRCSQRQNWARTSRNKINKYSVTLYFFSVFIASFTKSNEVFCCFFGSEPKKENEVILSPCTPGTCLM